MDAYDDRLRANAEQAQRTADNTLIYLAAGGIALTLAFYADAEKPPEDGTCFLIAGNTLWVLSLISMVASFIFSRNAHLKAFKDWQNKQAGRDKTAFDPERPGGHWETWLKGANRAGLAFFLLGLISVWWFFVSAMT